MKDCKFIRELIVHAPKMPGWYVERVRQQKRLTTEDSHEAAIFSWPVYYAEKVQEASLGIVEQIGAF